MKNMNNFQIAKVQHQGVAQRLLDFFYQFQPGVAFKSVDYKKNLYYTPDNNTVEAVAEYTKQQQQEENIQFETEDIFFLKDSNLD